MKKHSTILMACAASAIVLFSCAKDEEGDGSQANQFDQQFAIMAGIGNTAEAVAGSLAVDSSDTESIRDFGQMMINDHVPAQADLKAISTTVGLNAPDSIDAAHLALLQALDAADGREFDSLYIHNQVKDHQAAILLYEDEVKNGRHTRLRNYARELLPHLRMHLHHADSLAAEY